jgi:flagellar biosynthesis/type III secretory pathway protein FliH
MSIQKKSLISILKTTRKANVASVATKGMIVSPETQGSAKGFTKGAAKGFTKGAAKGFTKGAAKGFTKGAAKGFTKGYLKGLR